MNEWRSEGRTDKMTLLLGSWGDDWVSMPREHSCALRLKTCLQQWCCSQRIRGQSLSSYPRQQQGISLLIPKVDTQALASDSLCSNPAYQVTWLKQPWALVCSFIKEGLTNSLLCSWDKILWHCVLDILTAQYCCLFLLVLTYNFSSNLEVSFPLDPEEGYKDIFC